MTVVLIDNSQRYIGLSTDTKPASPAAGATFYETDTLDTHVFDGTAWQLGPQGSAWRIARGNWNFTDDTGATGAYTLFTVTGVVELRGVYGVCATAITSGGVPTIEVGVAGNTAILIAQVADATALIANEIWHDATPTTTIEQIDLDGTRHFVVTNGQDVILTIGTAALTAGDVDFYAWWRPVSTTGLVVAA